MEAATLNLEPVASAGTDLAIAVASDPGIVLIDSQKFDAWYDKLKAEAPTDADVSTSKGRDVLRSYAAKVRSEKAGIDKARLRLTKEWRDMTAQANAAGKIIGERLESLAAEVRKPLTDWEAAEKARVDACRSKIDWLINAGVVTMDDTVETVRTRGSEVYSVEVGEAFGDMAGEAEAAKANAIATLKAGLSRLEREEAERAELEKLRAEAAAREAKEAAEREERERVEREAAEKRAAEERRIAAEKAEAERIERERKEAAEAAQRDAERKAQAERDRIQREHDEALAAERRRAEDAERAAQAERDRVAAERAAAEAEAQRLADEQAAREADKKHRTSVKTAAKQAFMSCGADEETAKKIVMAIIAGEVPAITLRF
ncbi:hypothetical protein SAMN06295912_15026 [Sphingomonas laterariae]|uniref:Uncharacterized protein n=1 Tax=Edaphosphingomonas laterariae TaxID=861865 RepID=A0A239KER2_9SPHN|nr:hypothetical protein [Sphingomonas laterariae]SNT16109.1 hypothetical protein SAMN06295912_15026 [Sphingomonas laterariae]